MEYKILCEGKVIGEFLYECDCDTCIGVLSEMYDDVLLTKGR